MALFDAFVNKVTPHADVDNLAGKVGLSPESTEKAIAALGMAHQQEGDTVELASARTGIDAGTLGTIVQQIGGEGSLTEFARMLNEHPQAMGMMTRMLDRDGDGSIMDDLGGLASSFFGKK